MLRIIVYVAYAFVCAGAIAAFVSEESAPRIITEHPLFTFVILMGVTQAIALFDLLIVHKRLDVVTAIYFGLMIGFLLSYLLIMALDPVMQNFPYRGLVVMLTTLTLPYMCISLLLQTKDDFRFIIPYVEFSRELKGARPLILDTSALIDGRISDVIDTKILDSRMLVPEFVLKEIQGIADSSDKNRRARGRRGLDVISNLQTNPHADVAMYETNKKDYKGMSVDQRLVALAKELGGRVVTNDFNLNKVASVQGVDVINLNDVANSLRPRYLPGENLRIKVIKEGETQGQGVGYLDDGTMVICEQTSHLIGQEINLVVTSVLQSSAGRMIFGRPRQDAHH